MADEESDDTSPEKMEIEDSAESGNGEDDENVKDEENLSATEEQDADTHDEKLSTIPEESESVAGKVDNLDLEKETTLVGLSLDVAVPVSVEPVVLQSVTHTGGHVSYGAHVSDEPQDDSSDHAAYVERYRNLTMELTVVKHRNMLLQKKVLEHLKRRKLADSKTEVAADLDLEEKYLKQLQEFKHLKVQLSEEEHQRDHELKELREQTVELKDSVDTKTTDLVAKINNTANKLHVVKNARKQQTEMVARLTGRLVDKLAELSKLQLEHIKLRNRVTALKERKRELEVCGDVLNLATYEQLRTENQNLVSKVEDRDEELQRLREKAMTSAHNLAHIRQKTWAVDQAVKDKSHQLEALEEQFAKMREEMSELKKQREHYRSETKKLKQAAGLIIEPTLLRDYEQSADEVTRLSAELQNVRNSFYDDQLKLTNMRKMLQLAKLPDDSSSMQCVQISVPCQPSRGK